MKLCLGGWQSCQAGWGEDSVCWVPCIVSESRGVCMLGLGRGGECGWRGGAGDARPRLPAPTHLRVRHNCKWQQCHNEDTGGDQITLSQGEYFFYLLLHLINDCLLSIVHPLFIHLYCSNISLTLTGTVCPKKVWPSYWVMMTFSDAVHWHGVNMSFLLSKRKEK